MIRVRPPRGFSLVEVLITMTILGLLLAAVGMALTHVLDAEMVGASRQGSLRTADQLAGRLAEEARSATAVFVPSTDVLGQPNTGPSGGHEVDFFRKGSDGSSSFVAYRFDAAAGAVTRYEYVPSAGGDHIVHADLMAAHVADLGAVRTDPSKIGSVVGAGQLKPVNVYYGAADWEGGNGIVAVSLVVGDPGTPQRRLDLHLASGAAPTDVSILVTSASPTPTPGPTSTPVTVAFVVRPKNPPPHGPNHQGDPGGGGPNGGIHGPGIAGSAEFYGNGSGNTETWLEISSQFSYLTDGTYAFKDSNGKLSTVTITCDGGPCPSFVPLPLPTTGPTFLFNTAN